MGDEPDINDYIRDNIELKKLKILHDLLLEYYETTNRETDKGSKLIDVLSREIDRLSISDWTLVSVLVSGLIIVFRKIYERIRRELPEDEAKEVLLELFSQLVTNSFHEKVGEW